MPNLLRTVPFLLISDMPRSLAYYVNGLGFAIQQKWEPDGQIRWVWLAHGGAALMLQQFKQPPKPPLGSGVSIYFICDDALAVYHEIRARSIEASEPQVGNSMWEFSVTDPDGYRLHFESSTDVPEETKLSELTL